MLEDYAIYRSARDIKTFTVNGGENVIPAGTPILIEGEYGADYFGVYLQRGRLSETLFDGDQLQPNPVGRVAPGTKDEEIKNILEDLIKAENP